MKRQNPTTPVRTPAQEREYANARRHNTGKAERQEDIRKALEELGKV